MSAVGFEPTRIAPPELESGALDRSAKLTHTCKKRPKDGDQMVKVRKATHSLKNVLRGGIEPPTSCV